VLGIATSALRDAENGRQFLHSAIRATGVPINIIDGLEEARLASLGARQSLVVAGRRLALFDVGGGSTEVVLSQGETCLLTASLELGTLRLRSMWGCQDPATDSDVIRLQRRIALLAEPTLAHLRRLGFDRVALSCGAARALQRLAVGPTNAGTAAAGASTLQLDALIRLEQRLVKMTEVERRELAGHEPSGVDTLLTGAVALRVILQGLGATEALVASTGVREGLIADYMNKRSATAAARVAI
jgi:exopolyphosphatase/guanosine-5'-triphosphate,3'-diphosphate pyrophosphatase